MQSAGRMTRRAGSVLIAAMMVAAPALAQDTTAVASQQQQLSDAEVAAVALAAHQDKIQQGRLALEQTQNEQVRAFAQQMVDEYTEMEQELQQLLQEKELEPQENPLSMEFTQDRDAKLDGLRAFTGSDFDREYLTRQIAADSAFLDTLENRLIPTVEDEELRQLLTERVQASVRQHLTLAEERLRGLGGATGGTGPRG